MKALLTLTVLLIAVAVFATTAQDVKEKTGEAASSAVEYTKEQKDAFTREMKRNLKAIEDEIAVAKTKAGKTADEKLKALEAKQKNLKKNLAELEKSTGKAWSKLRDGVSKAWTQLEAAFSDAKKELKN